MLRSNIPMKRTMQIPKKKTSIPSYNTTMEQKKVDNKINKYAIITASSLQEQKQLYDDVSNMKKEYDAEIEQITLENQNIKDIFINFSAKWIQNLENKISETSSSLFDKTQFLSNEIEQFESKFNDLFQTYVILQRENQDLKDQILNEQNQLQDKSNEFDRLKLQFESFRIQSQNENQEILSRQLNNQQFEDENKVLQDQISQLSLDYQKIQNQYQLLDDSYRDLQKELEEKNDLISNLNSQIKSNEHFAAVSEMNQQNLVNENRILKEKLEMSKQMADILKNSPTKSAELQEKSDEIDNLRQSINLKDLEIEQLKSQIYELGNQDNHGQMEAFTEQISLKDQEIQSLNQKIEELTSKLNKGDSFQEFIDSLSQIADDTEQSKALKEQLDQKDEMIKIMQNQIQLKDKELSNFDKTSVELVEKTSLLNDLQQNVVEMKADIKSKNNSIEEFKRSIKEKDQAISNLTLRLDEKDQMIDNLESQALIINKEKENNEAENIEMKMKINSMTETLQSLQAKIKELESSSSNEKTNFTEEISLLKDRCQLLDLQNEEKQSLINEKNGQIEEFKKRQSFYELKMKEGDQLAHENDNLKNSLDDQKKQLETVQSENEELKNNLKLIDDEKTKMKLDLTQIEYDRNKLLEKVEDFESKFDKNLDEENQQLSQYVKELEAQIMELNTKNQKSILFEKQIKNYDDEMNDLKMMLDTYKKINEMLQDKLDQSNKQNSELQSRISNENSPQSNKTPTTPLQKATIACSPFKFDQNTDFASNLFLSSNSNIQEIITENENLKKEIEKWKKAAALLKNKIQIAENDRNFYQSECGRLNSAIETNEYAQKINTKLCDDQKKEIEQLKMNCEKLRDENKQIIEEKKEITEYIKKVSSELSSTKYSYKELDGRHKNFMQQLSNILHKETEQEIIFNVIQLINSSSSLQSIDSNHPASKIQYFSISHSSKIELFASEIEQKLKLANSELAKLEKKIELTSRKINIQISQSQISDEAIRSRRIPYSERKKPLTRLLNSNLIPNTTPKKSPTRKDLHFTQKDSPSNFGDVSPTLKELLFS